MLIAIIIIVVSFLGVVGVMLAYWLSSLAGEIADSLIFFPGVFWGVLSGAAALQLAVTQVCAKVLYEIVALPLTSWAVRSLKRAEGIDTFDEGVNYNPFKIKDI